MHFRGNPQSVQKRGSVRFCFPSVHGGKLTLQFTCLDTVFIGEVFFCIDGFFFFHDLIESGIAHHDRVKNGIFVILKMILLQERETFAGSNGNVSFAWLELSGEDL